MENTLVNQSDMTKGNLKKQLEEVQEKIKVDENIRKHMENIENEKVNLSNTIDNLRLQLNDKIFQKIVL